MSNLLLKEYITITTVIPGYTKKTWIPGTTYTTVDYWGYYTQPNGTKLKVYAGPGDAVVGGKFTALVTYFDGGSTVSVYTTITVVGSDSTTTTIPGHYEYTVIPDNVTYSYDPHLGWNSAARSVQSLTGDGTFSWYISPSVKGAVVGLNETYDSSGAGYVEITYGLLFSQGFYSVIEAGVSVSSAGTFSVTDKFSIIRTGNTVWYAKNDVVFYRSTITSIEELLADCSLYAAGDAVMDASISTTSTVDTRTADSTMTHTLEATPKAVAVILDNFEELIHDGLYSIDDEVHSTFVINSNNVESLLILKDWGGASSTNTNTLTGSAHHVNEMRGRITKMQAFGTSGYQNWNGASLTFSRMTAFAGSGTIQLPNVSSMMAAMSSMEVNGHVAQGVTNTSGTMTFSQMQMFASQTSYAFAQASFKPMQAWGVSYVQPEVHAELIGFFSSISGTAHHTTVNADLEGFVSSVEAYGGAQANLTGFTSTIDSTATPLFTGAGELTGFTSTLDSTATNLYLGDGSLHGFISTVTSLGGANAALTGFTISVSSDTIVPLSANGELVGFVSTVTSTATMPILANATLTGFTSTLSWADGNLSGFVSTVTGTVSETIAHAIAYNFNIKTQEMTKYTGYDFSHIIAIAGKFYGAKSDGLYLLEGATDNATAFKGYIVTKETDFGTYQKKRVQYAYLNSDKKTKTTAYADGIAGKRQESQFGGRRVQLGAGLVGRYWKFKIDEITKLEGAEFVPTSTVRKI